jgi:hypothetical protein
MKKYAIAKADLLDPCGDITVTDEDGELVLLGRSGPLKLGFIDFALSRPGETDVVTAEPEPPAKPIGYQRYVLKKDNQIECTLKQTGFWTNKTLMEFSTGEKCAFRKEKRGHPLEASVNRQNSPPFPGTGNVHPLLDARTTSALPVPLCSRRASRSYESGWRCHSGQSPIWF